MTQGTENLAVWWCPSKDDDKLQDLYEEVGTLPEYIAKEARDIMGRPRRGRLWISNAIKPRIDSIEWDDTKPCARRAVESGGIIIYKKDIDILARMPGFVTDLQMNMIRELN
jgi:hypothetical protein